MIRIDTKRHIAKTISWRFIGTIDTIILSWIISGSPTIGLSIGGFELLTKSTLYYFHERLWYKFNFGIQRPRKTENSIKWDPTSSKGIIETQSEFIQDETENYIKRAKVTTHKNRKGKSKYTVHLSYYDKKTKERFNEIRFLKSKQDVQKQYNIKIT